MTKISEQFQLLKNLCATHGPSGNEINVKNFILDYVKKNQKNWKVQPEIIEGDDFQDSLILVFGKPRTAIYAHMDSVGFTVRYLDQLVPIGSPETENGYLLTGSDSLGPIECELLVDKNHNARYRFGRAIERGTDLVFKCDFREDEHYIQSCYMDNRLGIYTALRVAENITDGAIVFSAWEEHGGGSVPYLTKYLYDTYAIKNTLVSDITWITDGIHHGEGVVISLRDKNIPRRSYVEKIIRIASEHSILYQLEVEGFGSSDGREIQISPYPINWCFIGAPEDHVHSPNEKVHKRDISAMIKLYGILMKEL